MGLVFVEGHGTRVIGARASTTEAHQNHILEGPGIVDHKALARTNRGGRSPLYIDLATDSPPYGRVRLRDRGPLWRQSREQSRHQKHIRMEDQSI